MNTRFFWNDLSPFLIIVYCGLFFIDSSLFVNSVSAEGMNPRIAFGEKKLVTPDKTKRNEIAEKDIQLPWRNYKSLRYEEDYAYLKYPPRYTDFWSPLKYIPLGTLDGWYLSIGGETRQRYEFYHNEEYGETVADRHGNNHAWLQRYMLHGDLHMGTRARVFTQFMSTVEDWRQAGPRPEIDENTLDLHQGFIDLTARPNINSSITLRVGRQEMEYGSGRLISGREAPNNRRSFDAIKLMVKLGEWSIDGFLGKPVNNRAGIFDDNSNPNKSLWGVHATRAWPLLPDGHVDMYYLGFENRHAIFQQGAGHELRHTLGTRIWGNPLSWKYNFEFVGQFGRFASNDIRAWAFASDTYYYFTQLPLKPGIGMRADITSGDNKSSTLGTYNPIFPTGAYFNLAGLGGPSNFIHIHPTLNLSLSEKLKASFDWSFFWRENLNDAIYSIGVIPIFRATSQIDQGRFSGSSPALVLVWEPLPHVTILASYVHFFPSESLKNEHKAKEVDYFTTWVTYKF